MLLFTNAMQGQPYTRRLGSLVERNFVRAAPDGRRATTGRRPVYSYEIRDVGVIHPYFFVRLVCLSPDLAGLPLPSLCLGLRRWGTWLDQSPSLVRNTPK